MDLFAQRWASYRAVVEHDLMEHRAVTANTAATLLQRLPLGSYTGLDLTAAVLPLAQQALGEVPYPCRWLEGDLLGWASDSGGDHEEPVDILHSAFAIHHLSDQEKQTLLQRLRTRIAPGGLFIWVDVFREPGESRDAYVQRYLQRIASSWPQLSAQQQEHVSHHLASYDNPADATPSRRQPPLRDGSGAGPGTARTKPKRWLC